MSDHERWIKTAREVPRWDSRNRLIAAHVPPGASVLDLGAGARTLRDHLPDGCRYQPVDLVPGPGVMTRDFNAGEYPELERLADVAVCSGVLEYLDDPGALLERLPQLARRGIVTYAAWRPYQLMAQRIAAGWVNHLTVREFEALVGARGLVAQPLTEWRGQVILAVDARGAASRLPLREPIDPSEPAGWREGFAALRALADREGHSYVAPRAVADGFPLGEWVREQQAAWRDAILAPGRAREFETLPGWGWTAADALWNKLWRDARLSRPGRPLEPELLEWLEEQRRLYDTHELHPQRVAACEALEVWAAA